MNSPVSETVPRRVTWSWFRPSLLALALLLLLVPMLPVAGQTSPDAAPAPDAPSPGRSDETTPRGTVQAYLDACRRGDYQRAAAHLDLSGVPADDGETLARHLKVVLDQKLWIDLSSLSDQPVGNLEDGLPPDRDSIGTIESKRGSIDILLRRLPEGATGAWKVSSSVVAAIPALYDEFGYGPLGAYLPDEFFVIRFLEIQLWQWLGLVVLVVAAYALAWLIVQAAIRIARRIVSRTRTTLDDRLLDAAMHPLYLIAMVGVFHPGSALLRLSLPARDALAGLERTLVILAAVWFAVKLVDVLAERAREHLEVRGQQSAAALLPMGRKGAKVALGLLGLLALLQNLGFNVTGVIAGLGVGGIAVALAAQKSLENLFGGLMLVFDQPVRVGEFCKWGDRVGTVEEVGLRSTRIRTLDRTVVAIPNAEFSNIQVENFAKRDRMRLFAILGLRYETTAEQLRHVLAELRRLLLAHPRVTDDPARVRFVGFGAYSLDLELFAYVDTADWNEFLAIREDLYLRIIDVVAASGSGFAFPSQTTYLARDGGLDAEKGRKAEEIVRGWREAGKLPFPAFPTETLSAERNTLDYPPEGSPPAPDRAG